MSKLPDRSLKGSPGWLTHSGRFTHMSCHSSATGRTQDRESSPAKDRHSTTEPRNQTLSPAADVLLLLIFLAD